MAARLITALLSLSAVAGAYDAPSYSGWTKLWEHKFHGNAGQSPASNTWNIIQGDIGVNNELQVYTKNSKNVQLSGGKTMQLTPWKDSSQPKGWTSGRVESTYTFTPGAGRKTRVESKLKFGGNAVSHKQGLWPAFWMLGNSARKGTVWPACGELDIMETVNGILTGYGTMHCDVTPGGICNEGSGIGSSISIPDQSWHTWRLEIDRTSSNWQDQSISWYLDGTRFQQITGARIGNADVWASVAQSSLYIIFNVAVGGTWPGNPDGNTQDGWGSGMEVGYVATYHN